MGLLYVCVHAPLCLCPAHVCTLVCFEVVAHVVQAGSGGGATTEQCPCNVSDE